MHICEWSWHRIRYNPRTTRYGIGVAVVAGALWVGAPAIQEWAATFEAMGKLALAAVPVLLLMRDPGRLTRDDGDSR